MFEPFVMIAMCDCRTDPKTNKKECTPFLRAFANGCQGIHVVGDYDHNGEPYKPKGVVSSDAKCCDCCENDRKVEVCYDLGCLIRREERNGGLENINITGGNGIAGGVINFSPPANDTESIATKLNEISYLGFTAWHASPDKPGFLCVSVSSDALIPKEASGCRFRRFRSNRINGGPSLTVSHPNYLAYNTTGDSVSAGAPGVTDASITQSNTHYFCQLNLDRFVNFGSSSSTPVNVGQPFSSGVLQRSNIYRAEFPDNSTAMYVPNYPLNTAWSDIWVSGGVNLASNRTLWANKLQSWLEFVVSQGLTYGNSRCYALWSATEDASNTNTNVDRFLGEIYIDSPCNIRINSIYGIQMNPIEINNSGTINSSLANHMRFFDEVVGVGSYVSNPYIDGVGGSTNWASDCSIASPFGSGIATSNNPTVKAIKPKRN